MRIIRDTCSRSRSPARCIGMRSSRPHAPRLRFCQRCDWPWCGINQNEVCVPNKSYEATITVSPPIELKQAWPSRPSVDCSWVRKTLPARVARVLIARVGLMSFKVRRSRIAMMMLEMYWKVQWVCCRCVRQGFKTSRYKKLEGLLQ